jgi:hypothetical protein
MNSARHSAVVEVGRRFPHVRAPESRRTGAGTANGARSHQSTGQSRWFSRLDRYDWQWQRPVRLLTATVACPSPSSGDSIVSARTSTLIGAEPGIKTIAAVHSQCRSWVKKRTAVQRPNVGLRQLRTCSLHWLGSLVPKAAVSNRSKTDRLTVGTYGLGHL